MKDETPITSNIEINPKNPRRVAQGKRLAEWSRQAKSRKAKKTDSTFSIVAVGCAVGLVALFGAAVYTTGIKLRAMFKRQKSHLWISYRRHHRGQNEELLILTRYCYINKE